MSSPIKFYGIYRQGYIGPANHYAGTQMDELPQGLPMLCTISTAHVSQRSVEQNARLHAMISDVRKQVGPWHGHKLSIDDWKILFTASLKGQRLIPGLDNSLVVMGEKTSHMSINTMIELTDLIAAWGAQNGVVFREKAET